MNISKLNLSQIYPSLDQNSLPDALKQNEFNQVIENIDLYDDDPIIAQWIDTFCQKISEVIEKQSLHIPSPSPEIITKPKAQKNPTKKTPKAKPQKPKAESVDKIYQSVVFIKRYTNLHGKEKSKQQVLAFIKTLQKAIAEKVIRKSDAYAQHIETIQKQLTKCYKAMGSSIKIAIDENALKTYKAIANSVVVNDSVKLFKAFLRFISAPNTVTAKSLLDKCPNPSSDLEKAVVDSLSEYVRSGECYISNQALSGIFDLVDSDDILAFNEKKSPFNNPAFGLINSQDFEQMHFETLGLSNEFQKIIGTPSKNFSAMVFGRPGSGKTTFCLKLATSLCKHNHKKVLFATIEEGINHTFQDKLKRMQSTHPLLSIANHLPQNLSPYNVIILDSVNTFDFDAKELRTLRNKHLDKIFIWIFQTTKNGAFRGSQEFQHDCDVVIEVQNGVASTLNQKNRFGVNNIYEIY